MTIRQATRGKGIADEISEVLGSPYYAENYYFKPLRDEVLGVHSTDLIGVSRYYMTLTPPVVVDFEPDPREAKFYVDEKRKFFWERKTVYVPIFLGEVLTKDQFATRVKAETGVLSASPTERALAKVTVEDWMQEPDTLVLIEQRAVERAKAKKDPKKVRGVAWQNHVAACKNEVVAEMREAARRGKLGAYLSRIQSALATGR